MKLKKYNTFLNIDRSKVEQVARNFMTNALKFVGDNGRIHVRAKLQKSFTLDWKPNDSNCKGTGFLQQPPPQQHLIKSNESETLNDSPNAIYSTASEPDFPVTPIRWISHLFSHSDAHMRADAEEVKPTALRGRSRTDSTYRTRASSAASSGKIRVRPSEVYQRVSALQPGNAGVLRFEVVDSGPGISQVWSDDRC